MGMVRDLPQIVQEDRIAAPRDCSFHAGDWKVLSNSWFPVARSDELTDKPLKARLPDVGLVVYRTDGVARVVRDLCAHRGAGPRMGWVEGEAIICPYHGLRYGPDGRGVTVPAHPTMPVSPKLPIVAFPDVERFGLIWTTLNGVDEKSAGFRGRDHPAFQPVMAPTIPPIIARFTVHYPNGGTVSGF